MGKRRRSAPYATDATRRSRHVVNDERFTSDPHNLYPPPFSILELDGEISEDVARTHARVAGPICDCSSSSSSASSEASPTSLVGGKSARTPHDFPSASSSLPTRSLPSTSEPELPVALLGRVPGDDRDFDEEWEEWLQRELDLANGKLVLPPDRNSLGSAYGLGSPVSLGSGSTGSPASISDGDAGKIKQEDVEDIEWEEWAQRELDAARSRGLPSTSHPSDAYSDDEDSPYDSHKEPYEKASMHHRLDRWNDPNRSPVHVLCFSAAIWSGPALPFSLPETNTSDDDIDLQPSVPQPRRRRLPSPPPFGPLRSPFRTPEPEDTTGSGRRMRKRPRIVDEFASSGEESGGEGCRRPASLPGSIFRSRRRGRAPHQHLDGQHDDDVELLEPVTPPPIFHSLPQETPMASRPMAWEVNDLFEERGSANRPPKAFTI